MKEDTFHFKTGKAHAQAVRTTPAFRGDERSVGRQRSDPSLPQVFVKGVEGVMTQ